MNIVSEVRTVRTHPSPPEHYPWTTGVDLTMADGSLWFHPYTGGRPIQLRAPFSLRFS